jgi:hypothetical protein
MPRVSHLPEEEVEAVADRAVARALSLPIPRARYLTLMITLKSVIAERPQLAMPIFTKVLNVIADLPDDLRPRALYRLSTHIRRLPSGFREEREYLCQRLLRLARDTPDERTRVYALIAVATGIAQQDPEQSRPAFEAALQNILFMWSHEEKAKAVQKLVAVLPDSLFRPLLPRIADTVNGIWEDDLSEACVRQIVERLDRLDVSLSRRFLSLLRRQPSNGRQ